MKYIRRLALAALLAGAALGIVLMLVGVQRNRSDIYAWFPDGRVVRVSPADSGSYYQACISPDGTNVIFGGAISGPPRIWRADLLTAEIEPLTPPDSAAFLASYRWDGEEIVFSSDRAFDLPSVGVEELYDARLYRPGTSGARHRSFNLFAMDPRGGSVRQLTSGAHRDLRASYTPDGERLTFYSSRLPRGPLWTMPADGSAEPERLPLEGEVELIDAYRPWYTVDGKTLYFFGMYAEGPRPYRYRILHVSAEGGRPERLAFDTHGRSLGPFLDPRGGILLFHNNTGGRADLYEYELGAAAPRQLQPPGLHEPPGMQIMHPTRARNGTLTFDLSSYAGSRPLIWLRALRARLLKRFRGR